MSIGSKKKDKDKDAKGASGGEASANYVIGSEGRSTKTTGPQGLGSTTRQDISTTTQRITSSSPPPSQDQMSTEPMATTTASSSSTTSTSKEVPYQYQYQQNYQQQREEQQSSLKIGLEDNGFKVDAFTFSLEATLELAVVSS